MFIKKSDFIGDNVVHKKSLHSLCFFSQLRREEVYIYSANRSRAFDVNVIIHRQWNRTVKIFLSYQQ